MLAALVLVTGCGERPARDAAAATAPGVHPRVLFVGLDGADWSLLEPWMAAGRLPELSRLVREGRSGPLESEEPPLSPLLWTTMMTGRGPLEHGILDFTRFDPVSGERQPITSDERRVAAIWNVAAAAKRSVGVFGLWATFPAERLGEGDVVVSDRLFAFQHQQSAPPEGFVSPPERAEWARAALVRAEGEIDCRRLREFVPDTSEAECETARTDRDPYARPISGLRRILVETQVYDELARSWIESESPDLAIVYIQGTDAIGHVLGRFFAPRLPSTEERDFARFSEVPGRYFDEIDRLLGRYRALAEKLGARLVLASDHGFTWSDGRPEGLSSLAVATAAKWHRKDGVYLVWGKGLGSADARAKGSQGERAGIARLAATLAALLDLPPGVKWAGPPLAGTPPAARAAVDYDQVLPRVLAARSAASPGSNDQDLANLRALGYLGGGEVTRAPATHVGNTRTPASFNNEGLILEAQQRPDDAERAYAQALAIDPRSASAAWNLSHLLAERGREPRRADELLLQAVREGLPEGEKHVVQRAIAAQRGGDLSRAEALVGAALAARPDSLDLLLFRGRYRIEANRCREALSDFDRVVALGPDRATAWSARGIAKLCLGDKTGAKRDLERSLALDPTQGEVRGFLDRLSGPSG